GNVKRCDAATFGAHIAVPHAARVKVVAGDGPRGVDVPGVGADRTRRVELRVGTVQRAHVAVEYGISVAVLSHDHPRRADLEGGRALATAFARPGGFNFD